MTKGPETEAGLHMHQHLLGASRWDCCAVAPCGPMAGGWYEGGLSPIAHLWARSFSLPAVTAARRGDGAGRDHLGMRVLSS